MRRFIFLSVLACGFSSFSSVLYARENDEKVYFGVAVDKTCAKDRQYYIKAKSENCIGLFFNFHDIELGNYIDEILNSGSRIFKTNIFEKSARSVSEFVIPHIEDLIYVYYGDKLSLTESTLFDALTVFPHVSYISDGRGRIEKYRRKDLVNYFHENIQKHFCIMFVFESGDARFFIERGAGKMIEAKNCLNRLFDHYMDLSIKDVEIIRID